MRPIKSDSEKKIDPIRKFAEGPTLEPQNPEFKELGSKNMVTVIGRKAPDEELLNYLLKDKDSKALPLEEAFAKYTLRER